MRTLALVACVGLLGCANRVAQDRSTGPDGKVKGAAPIALENGEAKAKGVVTYPGGDRVDWRSIEIPAGQRGQLDLQLTWRAPRPGLQVAFDVFDQWNTPIVATKASSRRGRTRTATINDAVGKYFVRIYAPRRGDAGAYTLKASFTETTQQGPVDPRTMPIPEPPRLAAVPPPEPTCDSFDPANKACQNSCPFDAPQGWRGCKTRDDAAQAAADEKLRADERAKCLAAAPKPRRAKIIHLQVVSAGVQIKLDVGSDDQEGLSTDWTAAVIGDGGKPLASGRVQLQSISRDQSRGLSTLTVDQLNHNQYVVLTPPPPNC